MLRSTLLKVTKCNSLHQNLFRPVNQRLFLHTARTLLQDNKTTNPSNEEKPKDETVQNTQQTNSTGKSDDELLREALYKYETRESKNTKESPFTWKNLTIQAVLLGVVGSYMFYMYRKKKYKQEVTKGSDQVYGRPTLGGPFELTNQDGKLTSSEEFAGKWLLMYFGFTHCPDICPKEMDKMADIIKTVDAALKDDKIFQPIFISVDPQRDTPEQVKKYIAEYHPKIVGLTGPVEKIAQICKDYRVYFSIPDNEGMDDYLVDHAIIMYLMDPQGNFVNFFGKNYSADEISYKILEYMKNYRPTRQ